MPRDVRFLNSVLPALLLLSACGQSSQPPPPIPRSPSSTTDPVLSRLNASALQKVSSQDYEAAIQLYQTARERAVQIKIPNLAIQYTNNIAACYQAISSYREAMKHYREALDQARNLHLNELENTAALNVASILLEMGETSAAAQAVAPYPPDGSTMLPSIRLQGLMILAAIHSELKHPDSAHKAFLRALEEADRALPPAAVAAYSAVSRKWPEGARELRRAWVLTTYAQMLTRQKLYAPAEIYALEAFRIRSVFQDKARLRDALQLAILKRHQKNFPEALTLLDAARRLDPNNRTPMHLFLLDREQARIYLDQGDFSSALPVLRRTLDIARNWRMQVLPSNSTFLNFEANLDSEIQRAFLDVLAKDDFNLNQPGVAYESFEIAEQARFASMRATLFSNSQFAEHLPSSYWAQLARFQQLQTLAASGKSIPPQQISSLEHQLQMTEIAAGLNLPSPNRTGPADLNSWLASIPADETLFSFYLSEPNSLIWIAKRGNLTVRRIPGRSKLANWIQQFSDQLKSDTPPNRNFPGLELTRHLFGDFLPTRTTTPFWTMVIDQDLARLAFAALPSPTNPSRFLIEDTTLRFLPSAMLLGRESRWSWSRSVTGIADPVYNSADRRAGSKPVLGLNRLVASAREWAQTSKVFHHNDWQLQSLTGPEANPANLRRSLLQPSDIIHISAHVISQSPSSRNVYIALSPNRTSDEAGLFGLEDLNSLRTNARLIVLSGCATAQGQTVSSVAINSLARGFLTAGASNVLATLWPVEDTDGPIFPYFYSNTISQAGSSRSLAIALGNAQRTLLRRGDWSSQPSYWASFILLGKG